MKVKVKKLWGAGIASVATPYVRKAIYKKEGLEIECNGAVMEVSFETLLSKNPRESSFNDKFGRKKDYSLYDFFWEGKK